MKEYKDLVVGLDIGSSKVMVVVGEVAPGGELRLAGLGTAPTQGIGVSRSVRSIAAAPPSRNSR